MRKTSIEIIIKMVLLSKETGYFKERNAQTICWLPLSSLSAFFTHKHMENAQMTNFIEKH